MSNNGHLRRRVDALEQRLAPGGLEAIETRDVLRLLEYMTIEELHQIVDDLTTDDPDQWSDGELQMVTELLTRAERRRAAGEKPER